MNPVKVSRGDSPVILGFPHGGTYVPGDIRNRLNSNGLILADTDWHIVQLYEGLLPGASTVEATFHRYVIDANRDPAGQSLYPGQNTTGLCPITDFDGRPIWIEGEEPSEKDIHSRTAEFHTPYHQALTAEVERVKALHGIAVVYDCHSIRSQIPFLFEDTLPDLNIGTDNGKTCTPEIETRVTEAAKGSSYSSILNGRFRGGWTTRHYGQPAKGWHAVQMEIAQSAYLVSEVPPFAFDATKSKPLREILKNILTALEAAAGRMVRHG